MTNRPAKILVIDDSPDNLITMTALINESFPDVVMLTATSGQEGIAIARTEAPDVILLDIVMPDMDGFAVCSALKADAELRDTPVVFVTAIKEDRANRIHALEIGAEGFLNKPIDESELAAQVQAMLKIKAAHRREHNENERLAELVKERTAKLEIQVEERIQAEELYRKASENWQATFDAITDFVLLLSVDHEVLDVNKAALASMGKSRAEVVGRRCFEVIHGADSPIAFCPCIDSFNSGSKDVVVGEHSENGRVFELIAWPIFNKAKQIRAFAHIIKDITERRKTEENLRMIETRLRQSEKMEAIGQLAGGIAHDFNNVLGGIIGFTDMSLNIVEKGSAVERNLTRILDASNRAKNMVQRILTFSRQDNPHKANVSISYIVSEVLELLSVTIPSSVRIESDLQNDAKPVLADPTQINELILNLAMNAVYAMKNKGTLKMRLYSSTVGDEAYGYIGRIASGEYSVVEVIDTGCGMDDLTLKKAFDPFFTTKPVGQGTGMGLSVVLGIVQSHCGDVQVETEHGKGTTFRIFLPTCTVPATVSAAKKKPEIKGGTEHILFVDDEKMMIEMAQEMLGKLGYKLTCMTSSLEALRFIEERGSEIDILITDQTMPSMTGVELAKAALKIRPDLPVILCTGYSTEINPERVAAIGIHKLAMKPLRLHEFAEILREVLDNRTEGADGTDTRN